MKSLAGGTRPIFRYGPVPGLPGLETLEAHDLRLQYERHFHDTYAFGIVLAGVERCSVGRALNFYEPGTVPMFNPGEVHDGGPATPQGWSYRMVYVDTALVPGERAFPRQARRDALARQRTLELFDAIDYGTALGIEASLALVLDTLLSQRPESSIASQTLDAVRQRIDEECCEPLRLGHLAALAGRSPTGLLRGFARAYGLSPHRYQHSRRVARAKNLILQGRPLAEVAAMCGYADQGHLNRWFLRIHGTTPGRFRRAISSKTGSRLDGTLTA
jgi:AraC-like DNA-binding protein